MKLGSAALRWLEQAIAPTARIDAVVPLAGSTSSALYRVDARIEARPARFVLRLFTQADWLAREPDLVAHEAAVLDAVAACRLPAPRLVATAETDVGFGAPALVMTFVEGAVRLKPSRIDDWIDAQAAALARIHECGAPALPWRYRSWTNEASVRVPPWSRRASLWQRAIDAHRRGAPRARAVFLHRDFHPVNVLWRDDELSGVVDWVNGCRGPAGVDVAHCRLNLALMFDAGVAARFARAYAERGVKGFDDPYWDIDTVFDAALPEPTYYAPWRHFGLDAIAQETLRDRLEDHLARVVARV